MGGRGPGSVGWLGGTLGPGSRETVGKMGPGSTVAVGPMGLGSRVAVGQMGLGSRVAGGQMGLGSRVAVEMMSPGLGGGCGKGGNWSGDSSEKSGAWIKGVVGISGLDLSRMYALGGKG